MSSEAEETRDLANADSNALSLDEVVGQDAAVQRLKALVAHARSQGRTVPHVLLIGGHGSGKSTLAKALSKEMGGSFVSVPATAFERGGDLLGVLTALSS